MKPHEKLIGLVILILLGTATTARAGDHAFHTRKDGVTVDWSLNEDGGGVVWAYGTVEATGQPVEVTLEFVALDSAGSVVARDREVVPLAVGTSAPPALALRVPRDPRNRSYELRIVDSASLGVDRAPVTRSGDAVDMGRPGARHPPPRRFASSPAASGSGWPSLGASSTPRRSF